MSKKTKTKNTTLAATINFIRDHELSNDLLKK